MEFLMKAFGERLKGKQGAQIVKLLGAMLLLSAGYSFAEEVLPKNEEALAKDWEWVRLQEGSYNFEERKLRIKSLPGNIWGKGEGKNILLKSLEEENVCITLQLTLHPETHGEQAGVLLYLDDDHYCKVVREWVGGSIQGHAVVSARELEGKGKPLKALPFEESTVVLRMVKLGRKVVSFVKGEKEDSFVLLSVTELPELPEKEVKIALYSSGAKKGTDHWAEFHSLTVEAIEADADPLSFLKL